MKNEFTPKPGWLAADIARAVLGLGLGHVVADEIRGVQGGGPLGIMLIPGGHQIGGHLGGRARAAVRGRYG